MLLNCSFFNEAFKIVVVSDCAMGRKWSTEWPHTTTARKVWKQPEQSVQFTQFMRSGRPGALRVTCQIGTLLSPAVFPEDATVSLLQFL